MPGLEVNCEREREREENDGAPSAKFSEYRRLHQERGSSTHAMS